MEQPQDDWPGLRWNLTAPESYVLNSVGEGSGIEAFKLALKELVARRALRVEPVETRRLGFRRERPALTAGPHAGMTAEQPLTPVLDLFVRTGKHTLQATEASAAGTRPIEGVLVEDFAKAARKELRSFDDYRDRHVVAALAARGLMRVETHKVIGVFPNKRKTWTTAGREAVDELEQWLRVGKERLSDWVSDDPAKAFAYTAGAGAAILLMDDLYPQFALLGQQLAERRAAGGAAGGEGGAGSDDLAGDEDSAAVSSGAGAPDADLGGLDTGAFGAGPGGTGPGGLDLGGLDLGVLEFDFGGFEGLGAAFSAVDSGVAAGGGDGGGGGGGGDGGGGGGGG